MAPPSLYTVSLKAVQAALSEDKSLRGLTWGRKRKCRTWQNRCQQSPSLSFHPFYTKSENKCLSSTSLHMVSYLHGTLHYLKSTCFNVRYHRKMERPLYHRVWRKMSCQCFSCAKKTGSKWMNNRLGPSKRSVLIFNLFAKTQAVRRRRVTILWRTVYGTWYRTYPKKAPVGTLSQIQIRRSPQTIDPNIQYWCTVRQFPKMWLNYDSMTGHEIGNPVFFNK